MKKFSSGAVIVLLLSLFWPVAVGAQSSDGGFSLQVSPSPIVETVTPGQVKTVDVLVRNTGTKSEDLKMGLRSFTIDSATGEVKLGNSTPKEVQDWVVFSDPLFSVESGKVFTQHVSFNVPLNAGFSYSFSLTVMRAKPATALPGKTAIEGSVAIFTLLSVDKPGATRKIDLLEFTSKKHVYEFLPTSFTLKLKNSGNSIAKPSGNIFVQRTPKSTMPLAALVINDKGSYILPDTTRSTETNWDDGFPIFKTDDKGKQKLVWDWGMLQKFRMGHYYANAVMIYNDGQRSIPVQASLSFWVIPWRLLGGVLILLLLVIIGIITTVRKTARMAQHKTHHKEQGKEHTKDHEKHQDL